MGIVCYTIYVDKNKTMVDIYYEGGRLGAVVEVDISDMSKEEAREQYMNEYDVLLDINPPKVEEV